MEGGSRACSRVGRAEGGRAGSQAGVKLDEGMKTLNVREREHQATAIAFVSSSVFSLAAGTTMEHKPKHGQMPGTPGYGYVLNLCPQCRGPKGRTLALSGQLLLTFLSTALLGQVLFALVKWKLSREAETLFTFRFDRLKNMELEGRTEKTMVFKACGKN